MYGFDDFNGLQLDALDTLANWSGADVTVSLPFESGRRAFKAVATLHEELLALGADELELAPVDDHYAPESRATLHHVERLLFEDDPPSSAEPGSAISFHSAGGERAEVELAAARILQLLRSGVEPGNVAVVFRDPGRYSSLLEQVFGAYGIPYSIDRKLPFGHTGLGRGLLALIRSSCRTARPTTCWPTSGRPGSCGCRGWRTASRPTFARRAPTGPSRRGRSGSATKTGSSRSSIGSRGPATRGRS